MNRVNSRNGFGCHDSTIKLPRYYYYYYYFFDPGTQFPGNEKITLCNTKKYKNQAGKNLTPPPPSQNSYAVRWHCTAESEWKITEIKS